MRLGLLLSAVTTVVIAGEYRIASDSPDRGALVCAAMVKALNEGAIDDVRKPVCRRGMSISSNREGLTSPSLQSVSLKDHRGLLIEMLMISASPMASDKVERIVDGVIHSAGARIYAAYLDPDNGAHVRKIYILDNTSCEQEWFSNPASPVVYVEASNGALDAYWGGGSRGGGYPFFYGAKTYYAQWQSRGERQPPNLALYEPLVVNDFNRAMFKQEGFGLVCSIEQK